MKGLIVCILMLLSGGGFSGADPGEPFIIIDKQQLTLTLYDADSTAVKTYRIACSKYYGPKERKGENKTPEGTFKINQLLNAKGLSHDFKDGKGSFRGKGGFRDGDDFKGGKRGSKFGGGRGFKRGDTGDFKNKKRDFDDED
jgi:hypothetical protein